jgi:exopolyphosphatase/guanosine-5'-triphosphate,3'-diphosphate pyrophosphatase
VSAAGGGAEVAATIDVGSNSVLLLAVAVDAGGRARAIDEGLATTRLGRGLLPGGTLDRTAAAATTTAVTAFARRAHVAGARDVSAFATGAVRRAADGAGYAAALAAASGVPVDVLSGEREAALAYAAVTHGLGLAGAVLAVDVGGLTTELTLGRGADVVAGTSLPLGALALAERHGGDLRAATAEAAAAVAGSDVVRRAVAAGAVLVASGGTPTALAALAAGLDRYEPRRVHGATLACADLARHAAAAATSGALDPGRAAILPAGACILSAVMETMGAAGARVSDHGVRHAYLRERLRARGRTVSMEALWG